MASNMPKVNILRLLGKFMEPVTGKEVRLTADDVNKLWEFFDVNRDGILNGEEYELFIRILGEFQKTAYPDRKGATLPDLITVALKPNAPFCIGVDELTRLLPDDERFLFLFRKLSNVESSFDFMKIWREFDLDGNGIIDKNELQFFLKKLLSTSSPAVTDTTIVEFSADILKHFDVNKDGNLQISEMSKLLPASKNLFSLSRNKSMDAGDLDKIFDFYDKDHNGVIENEEFEGLVKDMLDSLKDSYEVQDLEEYKHELLKQWDANTDGKISKAELQLMLLHDISRNSALQ